MQVIDLFAGGGGASEGILQALGVSPTLAVNHDPASIWMHAANHPRTTHLTEDLYKVYPFKPRRGAVDLLWGSPDCTHHSRAKGGRPLLHGRRLLAWVLVEWAREVHPRVLILENVPEFRDWGPLGPDDKPIKARKGETFAEFVSALQLAGFRVEWQVLNAADFGAPTARRRLFLIGRSDGEPIRWPEPTHGPGRARAWLPAAGCIDWSIPMLSVFATRAEAKVWVKATDADGIPNRPLAEATQRRIAAGVKRFVLENPKPFIVTNTTGHAPRGLDQPLATVTTGGHHALLAPSLMSIDHRGTEETSRPATDPLSTITTKARHALVGVAIAHTANGERKGQTPRVRDLHRPLGTVCASGSSGAVVSAWLAKQPEAP